MPDTGIVNFFSDVLVELDISFARFISQNSGIPNSPTNRRPQRDIASKVENTRTILDLFRQVERHCRWSDSSTASVKSDLKNAVEAAGMIATDRRSVSIRATSLEPNALASDQLRAIRRWLVVERPAIRARRFDEWRRDLDRRAADHKFEMVLRRHICIARPADHIEWSAESDPHPH